MINPNLRVDPVYNLVEQLKGEPDNPRAVTISTVNRLCWRLTDRIAEVLTALCDVAKVDFPPDVLTAIHQVEIARHDLHGALLTIRSFAPMRLQPEHDENVARNAEARPYEKMGKPLKFDAVFIGKETIEPLHKDTTVYFKEHEFKNLNAMLHHLPNNATPKD